jgi:hypothetical protein
VKGSAEKLREARELRKRPRFLRMILKMGRDAVGSTAFASGRRQNDTHETLEERHSMLFVQEIQRVC